MAFDFKKEYKAFYQPKQTPSMIEIPKMQFISVEGMGDPGEEDGEYQASIPLLYGVAYALRMSYKTDRQIEGYFEYVVPPLEGFWWQEGIKGIDYSKVNYFEYDEGLVVQCMHIGPYVEEQHTVNKMHKHMKEEGYQLDISDERCHHEIYISDPRRVSPEKQKTVLRHPVRPVSE